MEKKKLDIDLRGRKKKRGSSEKRGWWWWWWTFEMDGGSRKGGPRGSLSPTFNFRQSEKLVTSLQCLTSRRGPWEEDQNPEPVLAP